MNGETPNLHLCIICSSARDCNCRSTLTRYLSLLNAVHDRAFRPDDVLTVKPTSTASVSIGKPRATIDKLIFRPALNIDRGVIHSLAKQNGYPPWEVVRLKSEGWALRNPNAPGFILHLGSKTSEVVRKLILNPSHHTTYAHFLEAAERVVPADSLEQATLTRIDFAVDYQAPLRLVLEGLDVRNKRADTAYTSSSGQATGLRIGKAPETIVVYDKANEAGLSGDLTRIEYQLSKSRVPQVNAYDLRQHVEKIATAVAEVRLSSITFHAAPKHSLGAHDRLMELKSLVRSRGLFHARQELNQRRNFSRDFEHLFKTLSWSEQPKDVLIRDTSKLFNLV